MEERLLTAFVAVAEYGSVSEAARVLRITQPALTRQLQKLQKDLKLKLFHRVGISLELNNAGREFFPVVQRILNQHEQARQFARRLAAGRFTEISFGAPGTTLIDVVVPFVATLSPQQMRASVEELPLDFSLNQAVNTYDLVVMPLSPIGGVKSLHLVDLPVWVYVAKNHPWYGMTEVDLEDVVEQELVVTTRSFKSRRVFDGALEVSGLRPQSLTETNSGRVAQALVATGDAVAVVTDDPAFELHPIKIRMDQSYLNVQLHAAWRNDHYADHEVSAIAGQLREFVTDRYADLVG